MSKRFLKKAGLVGGVLFLLMTFLGSTWLRKMELRLNPTYTTPYKGIMGFRYVNQSGLLFKWRSLHL